LNASAAEILIVEDDEVIMGTLAYNLSRQGFSVKGATTGTEALRLARLNANLKRSQTGGQGKILEAGDLQLDTKNFTACLKGEPLDLRLKEFELLAALASAPGELKSREKLAKDVWGHAGVGSSRTIDVHIRRIRAALEEKSSYHYIHTARGLGYRFEAKPKSRAGVGADSTE
jgi:DNA-binding response OmpR family regulator